MWGAIIGDIVGSRHEFDEVKTKTFEFFSLGLLLHGRFGVHRRSRANTAHRVRRPMPLCNGGVDFILGVATVACSVSGSIQTILNPTKATAMVLPCVFRLPPYLHRRNTLQEALDASDMVTEITHNHPEGHEGCTGDHPCYLARLARIWRRRHPASNREHLRLRSYVER